MDSKLIDEIRREFVSQVQKVQHDIESDISDVSWSMKNYLENVVMTHSEHECVVKYIDEYVSRLMSLEESWYCESCNWNKFYDDLFEFCKWVKETEFVSGESVVSTFHEERVLIKYWENGYRMNRWE